ncbi:sensor histidine kinase [Tenacibaculum sp. M341]|uniref:sensor histidine kinase n=1 Tax=Tenacibaculum sp. M341 TaxID=2530339 RepID=UPI001052D2FC|nr:sensor histidine kinase [Tenacibaculum sp. M341]TCI94194.1 hypothetical protein EYW44_02285 [Tenacibaculum sp. M341]
MSKFDSWVDNKLVQNIFVWLCFFIILVIGVTSDSKVTTAFFAVLFLAPGVYATNYLILPLFNKKKSLFFLLFVTIGIATTFLPLFAISFASQEALTVKNFFSLFGFILLAMVFGMTMKISRDSFRRRQEEKNAELKLLKAQLNPHFLFNTLNNLYGLSVIKSDKLPDLMLKLSDLLRYSLYETKEVFVPLKREINYLENYISLEKIRLEEQAEIIFNVEGNIQDEKIAPMLFIVFVENAFKHLAIANGIKSKVVVTIKISDERIHFTCRNTYEEVYDGEENLEKGKSGIGLVNAKKRLDLLYTDAHQLKINKTKDEFLVDLILTK